MSVEIKEVANSEDEKRIEALNSEIDGLSFNCMKDEKIHFLKTVNKNSPYKTVKLYMSVLLKIDNAEYINGKEWYRFSEEDVDAAIVSFKSKSEATLQSYLAIIKDYLNSTTPENSEIYLVGYHYTRGLDRNDLLDLDENGKEKPEHMKKYYINKIGQTMQYITEEELDDIVLNYKGDASTKVMAILLFNGIRGESYTALASIRKEDVDLDSMAIRAENGTIIYDIADKYKKIFKEALSDKYYMEYDCDGKPSEKNKVFSEDSPYLLRRTVWRGYASSDPIDMNICNIRIKSLGKGALNPYITPVSVYNSGLVVKLIEECGWKEPTWKQVNDFRDKYNVKLSYTSARTIIKILLEKLTSPSN